MIEYVKAGIVGMSLIGVALPHFSGSPDAEAAGVLSGPSRSYDPQVPMEEDVYTPEIPSVPGPQAPYRPNNAQDCANWVRARNQYQAAINAYCRNPYYQDVQGMGDCADGSCAVRTYRASDGRVYTTYQRTYTATQKEYGSRREARSDQPFMKRGPARRGIGFLGRCCARIGGFFFRGRCG